MYIITRFCLIIFLVVLSGCASLSKDECLSADWHEIGYEDGKKGYKSSRLSTHRKACSEHHVVPDKMRYKQGRESGLLSYCSAENGLQAGVSGASYKGVCPHQYERAFLRSYRQGKEIYVLDTEIDKHQKRIRTIKSLLKKEAKNKKYTAQEVSAYKDEIKELMVRIEEKQKRLYYMKGKAGVAL